MSFNILLYGATGYSGGLIASEMKLWQDETRGAYRMILAARDAACLEPLADELEMDFRVFGLDDRADVRRNLGDIDVVINAAGPFAWTAERLAKVALEVECHYVDINGEADVYNKLDDLDRQATERDVVMVCGAGFWAAASDILLDTGLATLDKGSELGAIRIAMSRIVTFSRGSAETVWRSLREQVIVVRRGQVKNRKGKTEEQLVQWHEPVGKLERTFDFRGPEADKADRRIASAASLVDTLTASRTVTRKDMSVRSIESYVETGLAASMGYQFASLFAPVAAIPAIRAFVGAPMSLLSEGPTREERARERHIVLLDIEDPFLSRIINWRWETPNVYEFTAQLVVAVATQVAAGKVGAGWRTPAEALGPVDKLALTNTTETGSFRGCHLYERSA